MAVLPGSATGRDDVPASSRPVTSAPTGVLARADGVELIGEMAGSGYRRPPALVRRADGQTIQLTPLLYQVLEAIDGHRSLEEVAAEVSIKQGRTVTAGNIRTLADNQLKTMGLLVKDDGSQPEVRKSNPLLALRFKYAVTDPERTRRLTAPFARLFNPVVVIVVLAAFAGVCWWVFLQKGLASATYEAFNSPGLLLLVLAVTILSAGFHEFGHAAAARRGGATPGVMGAGVYLVWPAFYTDVTDSYRLGRGGRVRTDLGGLYFNAIVAVGIAGVWYLTRYDAFLLVVATQILQMVRQLTPLVRFDGYHVLADLTGVPDLFHRIKPTLLGLLPWRWRHPEATVLKPWARSVVTAWVLVVVPLLAFSLFTMVVTLPRILGTAWVSLQRQSTLLARAWQDMDYLEMAARVVAVIAVTFPILAIGYILVRLVRRVATSVWQRTRGRPWRRGAAALTAAGLVGGLAYAWWPHPGSYRPIQPYEGGTLVQAVHAFRPAPKELTAGQYGEFVTAWGNDDARPTALRPQLSLVLIPRGAGASSDTGEAAAASGTLTDPGTGTGAGTGSATGTDAGTRTDAGTGTGSGAAPDSTGGGTGEPQPWVFPFNKPLQPGTGDNQSLAVNTADNTVQYDVAFALVWITDDSPALNRNESYAFASCTNCAAVSVAFQIVLVTGENHVAAPQNIAAAVNYDCVNCLTYALATQLFLTLDGPLSDAGMAGIAAVWQDIAAFGAHITEVPLSEMQTRLTAYERQILSIIETEQGPLGPSAPAASPSATGQPSNSPQATGSADPSTSPGPSEGASPSGGSSTTDGTTGDTASETGDTTGGTEPGTGGTTGGTGGTGGTTGGTGGTTQGTTSPQGTSTAPSPAASPTAESSAAPSTSSSTTSSDAASSSSATSAAP
jgi:putative peptide zinc metalloprotease protein